ncbi:MCE family protein [Solirubrobacter sp. CPCC 204708]|uniref:MlaD family protein n=1 Tax=Solirubrobacter deserti TaxID=2282478 RepID=A0ABT4RGR6_9ACTN|nr:MlaD family protein [Solirubrobacter deserti]MBE2318219.1 MCE family protein [Solirubrobacter deserti]MDA0137500.1 MlaD family protein [Solirubrobacter deserti]
MARAAVALGVAALVALAVYLFVLRASGHEYTLIFENAGQLVVGDNVQIGGRAVGTIRDIRLTDDNQAAVKVLVEEPYAPLREGTEAVIRLTSLSGIANRYVAISPGPDASKTLGEGATIDTSQTTTAVDLDALFNTLTPDARKDLQGIIAGFRTQLDGKGEQAAEATKYFNPMLSSARRLVNEATRDEDALTDFIVSSSRTVTAIAEKREDLSALVGNANATTGAIASENAALQQALSLLPTTLRRGNSTLVNLRSTLDDLDPLVAESKPATEDLAPFLRELRPLVRDSKPTIANLSTLVRRPGADNDLVEATQKLPGFQRVASPAMRNSTGALQRSQPVLEFIRPYIPELVGWFRDFGVGAANYDANGHYARIQPIFNAFQVHDLPVGPPQLVPLPVAQRLAGLQTGMLRRCPGSASQPAADGSAPYRDSGGNLDCDPTQVLAGP